MTSKLGFLEAVKDLRYFLNRGYNRESAVRFVGDRYQLNRRQRLTLYRAVYDEKTAEAHMSKMVPVSAVRGRRISVDGYNTLITVESFMEDRIVVFCDDGFVRDVSGIHGTHKPTKTTTRALHLLLELLRELQPLRSFFPMTLK